MYRPSLALRHSGLRTCGSHSVICVSQNGLPRCYKPELASASYQSPFIPDDSPSIKPAWPGALGHLFQGTSEAQLVLLQNTSWDPQVPRKTATEERMKSSTLFSSAKPVQNPWERGWLAVHRLHRHVQQSTFTPPLTHRFSKLVAQVVTRLVHKIDAITTGAATHFSASSTGLTTTITSFIYKKNRKGALV